MPGNVPPSAGSPNAAPPPFRKKRWGLPALAAVGLGVVCAGLALPSFMAPAAAPRPSPGGDADIPPGARLVSFAPSLTETVFALGAGGQLAGVTRFCRYPPEAAALPRIGDYMQPNYEVIVAARPDVVLVLEEHAPAFRGLDALGLPYRTYDHRTLAGVLASFDDLGRRLGREGEARALRERLAAGMEPPAIPGGPGVTDAPPPRVLLVLGRDYAAARPRQVYAVGPGNLYDELLRAAGGRNAYAGPVAFPVLEEEGLLALQPDAIVELIGMDEGAPPADRAREAWRGVKGLKAGGRAAVIVGDAAFVPGPRTADFLDELRAAIRAAAPPPAAAP